jgi:type IV conjugative transfer system coupling protein TraD
MTTRKTGHQHFTRGGQIAFHNLRMFLQINKALLKVHVVCFVVILSIAIYRFIPDDELIQSLMYQEALLLKRVGYEQVFHVPYQGQKFKQSVYAITHHVYYAQITKDCFHRLKQCVEIAFGFSILIALLLSWYFVRKGLSQSKHRLVRGSQFQSAHIIKQQIKRNKEASNITIDGFPLIKNSEVQHLLVHGTVGTGKSQLIMKIMDCIQKRGDRAIVYDKGCALIPHYFDENRDVILNPYDKRCAHWNLWCEAPSDSHLENMAESLFPIQGDSDPFWVNAARIVFVSAATKMREDKNRSLEKLLTLLISSPFDDLEAYLQGTPAASLINSKIEKTSISIRSVVTTYLKSLQTMTEMNDNPFSIRNYLLDETQRGWIFISSNGEQHKSLKPLISMWLAMACLTMLSLEPNSKRRIWFVCDELPSLHKLPLLGETIAEVRKFGGCFLLGMQSFSQLEKVYGRSGAQEIFDLLNTRFFFRSASHDIARIVSRELGEEDIDESKENYSYGANSVRDGISIGNQRAVRPIVSYPEVLDLPNLSCYLRLPGGYPITKLALKHQQRKTVVDGLIIKPLIEMRYASAGTNTTTSDENTMTRMRTQERIHDYLE